MIKLFLYFKTINFCCAGSELKKLIAEGKRVLTRRTIEDYLIDDEVLEKFAAEKSLNDDQLQELKNINRNIYG